MIVNACPMCLQDEETAHHLLIHCQSACKIWNFVLNCFDMIWFMPGSVEDLFLQWHLGSKDWRGKILWKLALYATVWKTWLERNKRVFRDVSKSIEEITQSIVWKVSEWACIRKEFGGISAAGINRAWDAVLKGYWSRKAVHRVEWICPPLGTFKLNFDGSFVRSMHQGGIGGVIRNWMGDVVRSYSGPVDALDANEAEVYALLLGCRELEKLGGAYLIIEGDSFSTIQWASSKASYPWRIAAWVEEVQDSSKKIGASFCHILWEANSMADGLARVGLSRSSIIFVV